MSLNKCIIKAIALLVILGINYSVTAQIDESENMMSWTSLSVNKKFNSQWSGSYSQLHSIALDELEFNFVQSNLKVTRKLRKYLYVSAGYKPTLRISTLNNDRQSLFHRMYGEVQYTQKYNDFRFQHKVGGEYHFTPLVKFQQRYYYSLKAYYRNKDLPLQLRPYFTQKLFYYQGGNQIPIGNNTESGEMEYIIPNGFHAYRFQAGIRLKLSDRLNVSVYYMKQIEFNMPFSDSNLNVVNIETGRIAAPFYNFGVIGISMSYKL